MCASAAKFIPDLVAINFESSFVALPMMVFSAVSYPLSSGDLRTVDVHRCADSSPTHIVFNYTRIYKVAKLGSFGKYYLFVSGAAL